MPPYTTIINSKTSLSETIGSLREMFEEAKYLKVSVSKSRDRSLDQNRLFFAWVNQVAVERSEFTMQGVRNFVKLHFFVPILRAEDEEFAEAYDEAIKPLPYETKLKAISLMPVTSRCNIKQMSRGLEDMQLHYSGLDVDPVFLEFQTSSNKSSFRVWQNRAKERELMTCDSCKEEILHHALSDRTASAGSFSAKRFCEYAEITCPECHSKTRCSEYKSGQAVKCIQCMATLEIKEVVNVYEK